MWGCLWFVTWAATRIFFLKGDNCLTWAMRQFDEKGGYLAIRWCRSSRFNWLVWPHFLWLPPEHSKYLVHFIPTRDESDTKIIPHPWFNGFIKHGDEKVDKEN